MTEQPNSLLHYMADVRPEWIDRNDHMNNSYYLVISQHACLDAIRTWRGDTAPNARGAFGNFITQALVTYIREIRSGTSLRIQCRLSACDPKRAHVYAELINSDNGKLAAIVERTSINVLRGHPPKVVPYPEDVFANLKAVMASHAGLPYLEGRRPLLALTQTKRSLGPAEGEQN